MGRSFYSSMHSMERFYQKPDKMVQKPAVKDRAPVFKRRSVRFRFGLHAGRTARHKEINTKVLPVCSSGVPSFAPLSSLCLKTGALPKKNIGPLQMA